ASPSVARLTISEMGEAVLALLDALALPKVHLSGSSMGGATVFWLVRHHPERFGRLVLFRTSYRSTPELHAGVLRMAEPETWRQWRLDRWMSEQHTPQGGPEAWLEVTKKVADAFDPATSEHTHELHDLAAITHPTLLITGDRDAVVPLEDMVALYQTLPNAALWVMPQATHFMGTEGWRRASFEQEILRFLRRP
ncbi:MAG: alpha/beta hydrolase, partial [Ardenticatenales bacterium]|nr:alpha/beta hydrolase [Ardenticatenales bacterium]